MSKGRGVYADGYLVNISAMYWEGNGFVLVYKRLERGRFQCNRARRSSPMVNRRAECGAAKGTQAGAIMFAKILDKGYNAISSGPIIIPIDDTLITRRDHKRYPVVKYIGLDQILYSLDFCS